MSTLNIKRRGAPKKLGLLGITRFRLSRLLRRIAMPRKLKRQAGKLYGFVTGSPFGEPQPQYPAVVTWVIPDFVVGSGGHTTIFRIIHLLEQRGIKCAINIDGRCEFNSGAEARDSIRKHFFPVNAEVSIGREAISPSAALVATSWQTAYTVNDFRGAAHKFYFVQDMEPYFYPHGSVYQFAEQTYRFGFKTITAGDWLAETLRDNYSADTSSFSFSYDTSVYRRQPRDNSRQRVFFYARPNTPRRGFELGLQVLAEIYRQYPNVELVLAGGDLSRYPIDFPHRNVGVLSPAQLAELFNQCTVGLVLSLTNLSLLPLELMACGCVVVSNRGANVEWLLNNQNSVIADTTANALAAAALKVLTDEDFRSTKAEAGYAFALSTSWEREADKIFKLFRTCM